MTNVEGESESSSWVGGAGVSGLTSGVNTVFDINRISEILPHRYPFLLVDKVTENITFLRYNIILPNRNLFLLVDKVTDANLSPFFDII
eukprot:973404-Amorphochlora_amoeboformis.AAC.1